MEAQNEIVEEGNKTGKMQDSNLQLYLRGRGGEGISVFQRMLNVAVCWVKNT